MAQFLFLLKALSRFRSGQPPVLGSKVSMRRKNSISITVGLTLLPASAVALQDSMEQVQLPCIQEAQLNTPPVAVTKGIPIHNAVAPSIQLAQSDNPAGNEQKLQQNYLIPITEKAADTMTEDILHTGELVPVLNQNPLPTPARNQEKIRVDKIKSIVSEADISVKPEQSERQLSQSVEQTRKVKLPQQRSQQLREIIDGTPSTKDKVSKGYISILKDEVSTTVVIDEESEDR